MNLNFDIKRFRTGAHQALLRNEDGAMGYLNSRRIPQYIAMKEELLYIPYTDEPETTEGFNPRIYFNGYIVCPIRHEESYKKITSFTARNFTNSLQSAPKHKHFPGKQEFMLGQWSVKRNHDAVFLVEGLFDYLSAKTLKLNALGLLGVANFKDSHIDFILEHFNTVYIMLDNDAGGNKAAKNYVKKIHKRAKDQLKEISIFFTFPPIEGGDLNEWLINGCTLSAVRELCSNVIEKQPKKEKKKVEHTPKDSTTKYTTKYLLSLARKVGEVQPSGKNYKMNCINPEHNDEHASLVIYNNNKGLFCFGCSIRHSAEFEKIVKELVNN